MSDRFPDHVSSQALYWLITINAISAKDLYPCKKGAKLGSSLSITTILVNHRVRELPANAWMCHSVSFQIQLFGRNISLVCTWVHIYSSLYPIFIPLLQCTREAQRCVTSTKGLWLWFAFESQPSAHCCKNDLILTAFCCVRVGPFILLSLFKRTYLTFQDIHLFTSLLRIGQIWHEG